MIKAAKAAVKSVVEAVFFHFISMSNMLKSYSVILLTTSRINSDKRCSYGIQKENIIIDDRP